MAANLQVAFEVIFRFISTNMFLATQLNTFADLAGCQVLLPTSDVSCQCPCQFWHSKPWYYMPGKCLEIVSLAQLHGFIAGSVKRAAWACGRRLARVIFEQQSGPPAQRRRCLSLLILLYGRSVSARQTASVCLMAALFCMLELPDCGHWQALWFESKIKAARQFNSDEISSQGNQGSAVQQQEGAPGAGHVSSF